MRRIVLDNVACVGHSGVMNTALWTLQGLLAVVMTMAGGMKIVTPKDKLEQKMKWAATWPAGRIQLLGLAEVLGAVGLVVPMLVGIAPILTPIAAVCLAILMVGATKTHMELKEPFVPTIVFALLCLVVAAGRFLLP